MENLWENAKEIRVRTGADIVGGFDIGFHKAIPDKMQSALMDFVYWVEDHYSLPITLWVDFRYNHYLLRDGQRVGYRFYWVNYPSLDSFENFDDIPVIELAVRCEKQTTEDMLKSFVEAICCYFAWLSGMDVNTYIPDETLVGEILHAYQNFRGE